jgi:hypothetical protein
MKPCDPFMQWLIFCYDSKTVVLVNVDISIPGIPAILLQDK